MRNILIFYFVLMGFTACAQTETIFGKYYLKYECDSGIIEYKLSLHEDGTYDLHTVNKVSRGITSMSDKEEKGTWRAKDNMLTFSSKSSKDFDEEYTVNLNGSIARVMPKIPTEESDKTEGTVLVFDTSKIYCIEGLEFTKL